jgi:hypothetical protein
MHSIWFKVGINPVVAVMPTTINKVVSYITRWLEYTFITSGKGGGLESTTQRKVPPPSSSST